MPPPTSAARAPKVHLVTFGCQMNKYDSDLMAERFAASGYEEAAVPDDADVVAINTCSVRGGAEDRVYGRLGELKRLKRRRPDLVIAVVGCQAQREGRELLKRASHVDLVVGTREFPRLPELVERVRNGESPIVATDEGVEVRVERSARRDRAPSAFVAVMRGCDLHCAFCVVPSTRGPVRSRPADDILEEVRWLVADGVREVVLLGQTVNSYGCDLGAGGPRLAPLLRRLGDVSGLARIRLVTNHAAYLDDALIDALAEVPSAMPFLPVPVESGSDAVLRAMRRGYLRDLYRKRIEKLRDRVPGIELASDWIVGFPGETDEDFEKSGEFLREIGFAQNFIYRYSPRPGTSAFGAPEIPEEVMASRNTALLRTAEEVQAKRWSRYVGTTRPVLVEKECEPTGRHPERRVSGRTPEWLEVFIPGDASLVGEIVDVKLESATAHAAQGSRA